MLFSRPLASWSKGVEDEGTCPPLNREAIVGGRDLRQVELELVPILSVQWNCCTFITIVKDLASPQVQI